MTPFDAFHLPEFDAHRAGVRWAEMRPGVVMFPLLTHTLPPAATGTGSGRTVDAKRGPSLTGPLLCRLAIRCWTSLRG